jgi:hypothetical protein
MELKHWLTTLSGALQTRDVVMDEDSVQILLDLARDSAHEVERVAALGSVAARATALLMNEESSD